MATFPYPYDDYPASTGTLGSIPVGGKIRASFDYGHYVFADSDWFKVELQAGQTYVFAMSTLASFDEVELALRDDKGEQLTARAGVGSHGPSFEFTPTTSGTYFVDARALPGAAYNHPNEYEVSLSVKPAGDDYPAASSTTGTLALGVQKNAVHGNPGDADWFAFSFEAGKTYAMAPASANANAIDLSIVSASGEVLSAPGKAFTPAQSGTFYVSATGFNPGDYGFTLSEVSDEYAAGVATKGTIAKGGQVETSLNYIGDSDWFKVKLDAGTFYTFELSTTAKGEGIQLQLMKPDGTATDYSRVTDATGKTVLVVRVDTAGDYFANVAYGGFHSGDVVKPYTLKLSGTAVVDEYGDTPATAATGVMGALAIGEITGLEDKDVLKYSLEQGVSYRFQVSGNDAGTVVSHLVDANGIYYASGYSNNAFGFTPQRSGDYYLVVSPEYNFSATSTARYQYLIDAKLAVDDYGANAASAGKVSVGGSISGALTEGGGDRDWIGVELTAGQTYWLSLSDIGLLNYTSVVGKVVDASGNVLATTSGYGSYDNQSVPTLAITPTTSGTYYYEVEAFTTLAGSYKLSVNLGPKDDAGNVRAEAQPLVNNQLKVGELEVSTDVDFYKASPVAGSRYVIAVEGDLLANPNYVEVRYYDSLGTEIYPSAGGQSGNTRYHHFDAGVDIGSVSVSGYSVRNGTGYKIMGSSVPDDFSAKPDTTGRLAVNGSASGALEAHGDVDYFKVTLEAGKQYYLDLYGAASGGGTLNAANAFLLSVSDPVTFKNISHVPQLSGEARALVTPQASGDYYVAVGQYYPGAGVGSYRVTLTQASGDVTAPALVSGPPGALTTVDNLTLKFNEQVQFDYSGFTIRDSLGWHVMPGQLLATSVIHDTTRIDPGMFFFPGRTYTLELAPGAVRDLAGNAYAGPSSFTFTTPAASAQPSGGNDFLVSAASGVAVDGGAGVDTVFIPGWSTDYRIDPWEGRISVQPVAGGGAVVLNNVERVHFFDKAVALDVGGSGNAGEAYRLYKAAFDRLPDQVGVGFWTAQLDKGASLKSVAEQFLLSTEFVNRYGLYPSDEEFVSLLYRNVLHRAGEAEGVEYWNKMLDQGLSRAEVLIGFSDSPENRAVVVQLVGVGFEFTPSS